ncbi:MAG: flagellar biosynthesis protein FlhB [Halioglobus sp.]|nr:flagellar biosynthesis protein FlhB [Halioglobus sp.]
MADQQDTNERTEQPTQRRKDEARKKGQIARSRELNTMLSLLFAVAAFMLLGSRVSGSFMQLVSGALEFDRQMAFDKRALVLQFESMTLACLGIFVPFFAVMTAGALLGPLLMGGWSFSPSAMAFKVEKLNPISGLKRVVSAKGLLELLKALFKFCILIAVTVLLFDLFLERMLQLAAISPEQAARETTRLLLWGFFALSCALVFIVVFDVPFELWNHNRQLKMTRQEVRDEMKETEGRPEVKGRIRNLQREIAQRRMMEDVPGAHVVITNPTHFAVALKYDESPGAAPKVVAKGRDLVALRIRALAAQHDVAIFSAPPLARALYASTEIGDEIPQNLYLAVARVLAYVFQLRRADPTVSVPRPTDLDVPEEYRDSSNRGGAASDE